MLKSFIFPFLLSCEDFSNSLYFLLCYLVSSFFSLGLVCEVSEVFHFHTIQHSSVQFYVLNIFNISFLLALVKILILSFQSLPDAHFPNVISDLQLSICDHYISSTFTSILKFFPYMVFPIFC